MLEQSVLGIFKQPILLVFIALIVAFWISLKIFPSLIHLSKVKNLMEDFNDRKVHTQQVSNLGGVGIFVTFSVLTMTFYGLTELPPDSYRQRPAWIAAATILFFLGLKDDLLTLSPKKKFLGQLTAVFLIVVGGGLRIASMDGIFGIFALPYFTSIIFTSFVMLLLINAFNLIDGIDGLAGSVALFASLIFGVFFIAFGNVALSLASFVLAGSLIGFLRFNFSSSKKIFMGDSGSMLLGYLLSCQSIFFMNQSVGNPGLIPNAPILVLAILSMPLLDTLRVFIIRVLRGSSPFHPDNNHLHHILLRLGLNHKQSTAILLLQTLLIFTLAYLTQGLNIHVQLALVVGVGIIIYLVPILAFKHLHTQFSTWYMNLFESETN